MDSQIFFGITITIHFILNYANAIQYRILTLQYQKYSGNNKIYKILLFFFLTMHSKVQY